MRGAGCCLLVPILLVHVARWSVDLRSRRRGIGGSGAGSPPCSGWVVDWLHWHLLTRVGARRRLGRAHRRLEGARRRLEGVRRRLGCVRRRLGRARRCLGCARGRLGCTRSCRVRAIV